ncbi:pyridoxal phosphate-dependent transferase [Gigaspora rosea]|uniref:Glutamate decarboxylase n=1 Tax=Gigaspora rosea TaxID=44941 RepID=A0A397UXV4_9GLOM|nr:pyridoxal phosphate-dependent transferase [Gigaspora rosea]
MVYLSRLISDAHLDKEKEAFSTSVYGSRWDIEPIPKYSLPDNEMPAKIAYKLIRDDLQLDGNPVLNLAAFLTTYMEEEAEKLMTENMSKNFIDYEEYPMTVELQTRCVNIIANLFNAPKNEDAIGVSTVGSSEAMMLAVLAMKKLWKKRREAEGKPTDKPNIVMSASVQVCWEKAARYFEIEEKFVYLSEGKYILDPEKAVELVDENTIGIAVILGSTYTGHYEDVKAVNDLLLAKNKKTGWDVPIHVDAASGGFVAPFVNPDLVWDFRLELVRSINVSGHKYGLCYPGIGWALWKSKKYLPDELVFNINYLGSNQASFTLNFSKNASNVISQYYVLIRLGRQGFTSIMENLMGIADYLASRLEATNKFEILSDRNGNCVPLVAFRLKAKDIHYDEFDVAHRIREHQWIVPSYTMAPNIQHIRVLRVVIREDFSRERCDLFVADLMHTIDYLDKVDKETLHIKRNAAGSWKALKSISLMTFDSQSHKTNGVC